MKIDDLEFVIENLSGSYKKFADSLDEYPILGVTYPTHYGYIKGYRGEDGHELDVFVGNGSLFGTMTVRRSDADGGVETKMILGVSETEAEAIKAQFEPVVEQINIGGTLGDFFEVLAGFKVINT